MQRLGDDRQVGDLDASASSLVGGDGLLRDAQRLGQLHLGDALFLAQLGDAAAELHEKRLFFLAKCHGDGCGREVVHTVSLLCGGWLLILPKVVSCDELFCLTGFGPEPRRCHK